MQASFRPSIHPSVRDHQDQRPGGSALSTSARGSSFRQALAVAGQAPEPSRGPVADYEVREGDTLSAIAFERLRDSGAPAGRGSVARAVQELARANGIENPDRIFVGQRLRLDVLGVAAPALAEASGAKLDGGGPPAPAAPAWTAVQAAQPRLRGEASPANGPRSSFPQLDKTLDRAVDRGFMDASERTAVRDRIVELSRKFRFSPDDFATVSLMESDGLNPKASNGQCHGIIQFCEGAGRGAASVGMQGRAQEIKGKSVLEQLDLVDRYFEDTGLKDMSSVSLVDLYLTVLTPAARSERRPNAALGIAGPQASVLHTQGDRNSPITRNSIFAGLQSHANQRLGIAAADLPVMGATAAGSASTYARVTAMRGWQVAMPGNRLAALEPVAPAPMPTIRPGRQG